MESNFKSWEELPNHRYIRMVLTDLNFDSKNWPAGVEKLNFILEELSENLASDALSSAVKALEKQERFDVWSRLWLSTRTSHSGYLIANLLLSLVAWDHTPSYFSLSNEKIKSLAYLGDPVAVLICPAVQIQILKNLLENV